MLNTTPSSRFPRRLFPNGIGLMAALALGLLLADFSNANAQSNGLKTIATNLRGFGVPFRIDAADDSYIEVQLYLSRDEGKTWQFHARQSTDASEFPFYADEDGTYWFALKTLDRDRRLIPEGDAQAELEIEVDTVKPELDFQVQTDAAGRVVCRWKAVDKNIRPETLKILHQPAGATVAGSGASQWTTVDIDLTKAGRQSSGEIYADEIAWWPSTTTSQLNVRLAISDAAGNLSIEDRQVNVPHATWRHRSTAIARPQAPVVPSVAIAPAADHQHQTGVVCENGVCRLVDGTASPKVAANSSSDRESSLGTMKLRRKSPKSFARPSGSPPQHTVPQRTTLQRTASRTDDQTSRVRSPIKLVGSSPEKAAPPVPDDYRSQAATKNANAPAHKVAGLPQPPYSPQGNTSRRQPPSVAWPSEKQQWAPRNQSVFSTTVGSTMNRQPDSSLAPNRPDNGTLNDGPLAKVNPNPGIQMQQGDRNIGQSSTNFPGNQYQGPPVSPEARQLVNRPPTLLPNQTPAQSGSNSLGPLQNYAQQENRFYQGSQSSISQSQANENEPAARPTSSFQQSSFASSSRATPVSRPDTTPPSSSVGGSNSRSSFGGVALQMISTKRFRLDYAIDAIDPSGVKQVDLWMTRDEGRTWQLWGKDPDSVSPFPVEVQDEGRYGFRVVIQSRDGLSGQGPASGDAPDMLIQVDSESPLTRITSVPYGRGPEAGKLVINWSVSDPFLTLRPVRLSYSRSPRGPWTLIENGLRNTGRYVWKVLPNVPDRIFLKIEATDRAGNVGVHQPSQAIDVSGLVPRGTIRGVQPVGAR